MTKSIVNAEITRCYVRHNTGENMVLPEDVRQKISQFFEGQTKSLLTETREKLTYKYKTNQAVNKSVFDTKQESFVYAISRIQNQLFVFGGEALRSFSFTILWGVVIGTYSSIYISAVFLNIFDLRSFFMSVSSREFVDDRNFIIFFLASKHKE